MAVQGRSARGELVDFDILAIKQQLASKPVVIGVNERRTFIDTKDGIKQRISTETKTAMHINEPAAGDLGDMLAASVATAQESLVEDFDASNE